MTKVIIIQGGSLESYYDLTMDYLFAKYHSNSSTPSTTPNKDSNQFSEYYEYSTSTSA